MISAGVGTGASVASSSGRLSAAVSQAASAASLLLCAGEKGQRFALPNSRVMLHQPSGGAQGQASDISRHAQEILKLKRRLNEIYAIHTGQTVERIEKALDRDNFLTAEEAKAFGLIDQVFTKRPMVTDTVKTD